MTANYLLAVLPLLLLLPLADGSVRLNRADSSISYQQFLVESVVVARYATTTITSVVCNEASVSQELSFQVQLPATAFISAFSMVVNGTTYYGRAEEKAKAAEEFEERQQAGENVGLVESRGTDVFLIRINTAATSNATFVLQYEELLVRRNSVFEQVLTLNPGSVVEDLRATVRIIEEEGISLTGGSDYITMDTISDEEVQFSYSPSVEQQMVDTALGLARDMIVSYDVNHPAGSSAGQFVVNDCYFAQFFSPSGIDPIPVDLVFVIDVSGSMSGRKIEQTREALVTIITDLRATDRFTMVTFETEVSTWRSNLVSVTEFRQEGINFANSLVPLGNTNFNGGLLTGAEILRTYGISSNIPLLVILTDGQPTAGITNTESILQNARNAIINTRISLNCLGFGSDLNFDLLERLALANNGIVRQIYEGEDADAQLEGFFTEISSPILSDIEVTYEAGSTVKISNTAFPLLFDGSELVIAGRFSCVNTDLVSVQITGIGQSGELTFTSTVDVSTNSIIAGVSPSTERLTAYLFIQELLDRRTITDDEEEVSLIEAEALELALEYNFVTELTSLIVVQEPGPDGTGNFTLGEGGTFGGGDEEEFDADNAFITVGGRALVLTAVFLSANFMLY